MQFFFIEPKVFPIVYFVIIVKEFFKKSKLQDEPKRLFFLAIFI